MIPFRTLELTDREWIEECLKKSDFMGAEYSFTNNFLWAKQYNLLCANVKGFYCTLGGFGIMRSYGYPTGEGNLKEVIEMLMEDAKERGLTFEMRGIPEEKLSELKEMFPEKFDYISVRDEADYVYLTERLSTLAGKKLHGKRNHIARFKDNPNWVYEPITMENIEDCKSMSKKWCELYNCREDINLVHESCAVKTAFKHFDELKLVGGLIRLEGEVIAFTMGEALNSNTFIVHIEKAFSHIQGAYPMINQQFVLHECQDYEYVNREDDMGDEGLRKAKLSYYPDILLEKYKAVYKTN